MTSYTERGGGSKILSGPAPASIKALVIVFNDTNVKEYEGYSAMTIDNVLAHE
ncbi:hypothetical protein F4820DRAFT_408730 [Hypoxylon rubiginosum]|uniref:Uncharacterized protein n=1 Tax=Hypoxylon rubiginosum TaxID=110542 RepID=A0ACB9ZC78_9PEZI|nr:hypothetical protein F4820DRAFT_408730 [Hypoxylon rubiginosum]